MSKETDELPWGLRLTYGVFGIMSEAVAAGALNCPVEGSQNLDKLNMDRPAMVVTSHLTDVDVQTIVLKLWRTKGWRMVIANQSTQLDQGDLNSRIMSTGIKAIGPEWFLPIGWTRDRKGNPIPWYMENDYNNLERIFKDKRILVVAGHNPTFNHKLPNNPGFAAVIATQLIEGLQVLPVVLTMKGEPPNAFKIPQAVAGRKGRDVRMVVGEPFEVKRRVDVLSMHQKINQGGVNRSIQDKEKLREYFDSMREIGCEIMGKLAELLPPESRGKWGALQS